MTTTLPTALYTYVTHTLCNTCRMLLVNDDPQEWEADKDTGNCSRCRNRKHYPAKGMDEAWPSQEAVAFVEKDSVHPSHYC